jgi:hypothetical protein
MNDHGNDPTTADYAFHAAHEARDREKSRVAPKRHQQRLDGLTVTDPDLPRTYEVPAVVKDGDVVIRGRSILKQIAADLGDGAPLIVTIAEDLPVTRSQKSSRYYFGIVVQAGVKCTGNSPEMVHRGWKAMFLPDADLFTDFFNWFAGQEAIPPQKRDPKTRDLPIHDFYDFVEECRLWLRNEYQHDTPDPDPLYWRRK